MDKFKERYHVRFANLQKLRFDDRILNGIQLDRLRKNPDVQVLYIENLGELKKEVK